MANPWLVQYQAQNIYSTEDGVPIATGAFGSHAATMKRAMYTSLICFRYIVERGTIPRG